MQKKVEAKEMERKVKVKDDTFMIAAMGVIFILWQIVILFGFWGGNPEGCFKKIEGLQFQVINLQVQIQEQIVDLSKKYQDLELRLQKQEQRRWY